MQLYKHILVFFTSVVFCKTFYAQSAANQILADLNKLNTFGSVLYIAAHPDDENTRLLAYLANEKNLQTAYLSLTRGDGGQNLIGSEQGIELGIIRTQELLAARKIDGAQQFFTRAYDFGYSKTPDETLKKWNKDSVLSDMVWVIRTFKPDIIITRFATDGSGGHGHHTASAILAEDAFDAAADSNMFSWQVPLVGIWQAKRLFWNVSTRFTNPNADMSMYIPLNVGGYNVLQGKSYGEIAAESRSMHKSQGFGSAMQRGNYFEYFKPIKGDTFGLKDIFQGIDFTMNRYGFSSSLQKQLQYIIKQFNPQQPDASVNALLKFKAAFELIKPNNELADLKKKDVLCQIDNIIAKCLGIYAEAVSNKFYITDGDSINVQLNIIKRIGKNTTTVIAEHTWGELKNMPNKVLEDNEWYKYNYVVKTNTSAVSQLPWLVNGLTNNLFSAATTNHSGMLDKLPRTVIIKIGVNKISSILLTVPVKYKWVEPDKGELHRDVLVVPKISINISKEQLVFNKPETKQVTFRFTALTDDIDFTPFFECDSNFIITAPDSRTYKKLVTGVILNKYVFAKAGNYFEVTLNITPRNMSYAVKSNLYAYAMVNDEKTGLGLKEIRYNHIPVQTWFPQAKVALAYDDIKIQRKNILYVKGAGDEVSESLKQLGYKVLEVGDEYWKYGDLNNIDAVVIGVRAYNTSEVLHKQKEQLDDFVKNGGTVVVQYQTNSFFGPLTQNIGPYPFKINRNRITNEDAKVKILQPQHRAFNVPNKITLNDFNGWVQERSIYHAGNWDKQYMPLLSMADDGEAPDEGALIVCKYGKGYYVYTGLSFFRQLPAANTGALKLLVNLIELKD
jgi:LmbE family N-acetylglucosaminyl deacetylase